MNYALFRKFAPDMEKKRHALRKLLEAVEKELLKKPNRKTWQASKTGNRSRKPCRATWVARPSMEDTGR